MIWKYDLYLCDLICMICHVRSMCIIAMKKEDWCESVFWFELWIVIVLTVLEIWDMPIPHSVLLGELCFDLKCFHDHNDVNCIYILWCYLCSMWCLFLECFKILYYDHSIYYVMSHFGIFMIILLFPFGDFVMIIPYIMRCPMFGKLHSVYDHSFAPSWGILFHDHSLSRDNSILGASHSPHYDHFDFRVTPHLYGMFRYMFQFFLTIV